MERIESQRPHMPTWAVTILGIVLASILGFIVDIRYKQDNVRERLAVVETRVESLLAGQIRLDSKFENRRNRYEENPPQ